MAGWKPGVGWTQSVTHRNRDLMDIQFENDTVDCSVIKTRRFIDNKIRIHMNEREYKIVFV